MDNDPAVGKSLRDQSLRATTGATLLAVIRDSAIVIVPSADLQLQKNDLLVLAGNSQQITDAVRNLTGTADVVVRGVSKFQPASVPHANGT